MAALLRGCAFALVILVLSHQAWQQMTRASEHARENPRKSDQAYGDHSGSKFLDIKHISQENLLCVPTSASMILAFYGDQQSPRKLKALSGGTKYAESAPFTDFSVTFYRDIVKAVATLGYDWSEQTLDDNESGFRRGLAIIKDEIDHRRPVMIDVSAPEGHTIVVAGLDQAKQSILVIDPNASAPGRYTIPYAELRVIWNEHAFNHRFRSLVITSPRKR